MIPPTDAERAADADPDGCLRCCVAALFEVPLASVPRFCERIDLDEFIWYRKLADYLRPLGFGVISVHLPKADDDGPFRAFLDSAALHVRVGQTPLGVTHAVVYRGREFVYDCLGHDESAFLPIEGGYIAMLFVPVDLAGIVRRVVPRGGLDASVAAAVRGAAS